jgi:hypothetical protein
VRAGIEAPIPNPINEVPTMRMEKEEVTPTSASPRARGRAQLRTMAASPIRRESVGTSTPCVIADTNPRRAKSHPTAVALSPNRPETRRAKVGCITANAAVKRKERVRRRRMSRLCRRSPSLRPRPLATREALPVRR